MKKYLITLLIVFGLLLIGCGKQNEEEEFKPNKIEAEHGFVDEEFQSYLKLSTNLELDNQEIYPIYAMTAFMHILGGTNRKILYYQVDWITENGYYDTYYRNEFEVTTPSRFIGQKFLPSVRLKNNEKYIKTINALYKYQSEIQGVLEEREVKYSEKVIKFNSLDFIKNNAQDDILSFNIYKFDFDDDKYHFKFEINFKKENEPIHLDMQSWLKTKEGDVFPLLGLYNYATFSEDFLSVSDEIVDKIVDIEEIYMKINYKYNEVYYTLTNIFNYAELKTLVI